MTSYEKTVGNAGEVAAMLYLQNKGYHIRFTQWHCPYGEIDIIAEKQAVIIFVEVKTRRYGKTQEALAAISRHKAEKIVKAAQYFLSEQDLDEREWRIDAIAVLLHHDKEPEISHVEDVLDW